ncbi:AAA domain-containing protein [Lactifluus volemus]|nr:AAA domain-containing protein [Lactifluus volemus]
MFVSYFATPVPHSEPLCVLSLPLTKAKERPHPADFHLCHKPGLLQPNTGGLLLVDQPTRRRRVPPHMIEHGKTKPYKTRSCHGHSDRLFAFLHQKMVAFPDASPLRSSVASDRSPRFDWRLRAPSRAPASRNKTSRAVRQARVPQHFEIEPEARFHNEVKHMKIGRFLPLLALEQAEEERELRERLQSFWLDPKFGHMAAFNLGPGIALPDNKFEGGTSVLVTRLDPLQEVPMHGRVLMQTSTQLRVSFRKLFDLDGEVWRLDLGQSNIAYERMCTARDNSDPGTELVLLGTHLRDVFLRSFSSSEGAHERKSFQAADDASYAAHGALDHPGLTGVEQGGVFKDDLRIQSWTRRYSRVEPIRVEGDPELNGLNATQIRAIAMMVGNESASFMGYESFLLFLVGLTIYSVAPGTGKSKTIVEAVRLLKADFEVHVPILVCTYTNMALDHVVEGLVGQGLKPLRVGIDGKVRPALKEYTLEAYLDRHPQRGELERLFLEEMQLREKTRHLEKKINEVLKRPSSLTNLKALMANAKLFRLRQAMITDVLKQADVSQHVVLIGDHQQLPPVIRSREAQLRGLNISLFERLTEEGVVPSIMLDMQYRMHPEISRFPSSEFYARSLKDGTVDTRGNVLSQLRPPLSEHLVINPLTGDRPSVVFLDHDGLEATKDRSRINVTDAAIVCAVIEDLLRQNEDLRGDDIGIISPYAAQISLLNYLLNMDPDQRERFCETLGPSRAEELAQIEVKTVNGFEGRQKEVVLFSTVRNNASGALGFLADRQRLNVGLTRARRGLFLIGGLATLRAGSSARGAVSWKHYADFLTAGRLVRPLKGDALLQVLDKSGWRSRVSD